MAGTLIAVTGDKHLREDFRQLTPRERDILEMLLSVETPGIEELRTQVPYVEAARWNCGCASFDLRVDRQRARRSPVTTSPTVEAITRDQDDVNRTFGLLLWVEDGWLSGVEIWDIVDRHGEESPAEIPPPEEWLEPQARVPAS